MLKLTREEIQTELSRISLGSASEYPSLLAVHQAVADAASRHTAQETVRFFREKARGGLSYDASWDEDADMLVEHYRKEGIEIDA